MAPAKELASGIGAHGRSKSYHRRGVWAIKKKNGGKLPVHAKKAAAPAAAEKAPRLYPADDVKKPVKRRVLRRAPKHRASVAPGRVLILLAGRFKGKRAVCLAHLASGLLLVAGPFSVNGVPLRRVNPAYVIGTSTTVDVAGVDVAKYDDAFFRKAEGAAAPARPGRGGDAAAADAARAAKAPLPAAYLAAQKAVDAALAGKLDADLKGYLGATFSLQAGDRPHLLKF